MRKLLLLLLFTCGSAIAAFPTVESQSSGTSTADATPTLTMPATVGADSLIVACHAVDTDTTLTWNTATYGTWTQIFTASVGGVLRVECRGILADGDEDSGTFDNTLGGASDTAWFILSISGWENDTVANGTASANATANDANPDPPNLTPGWGDKDTLWIAMTGWDRDDIISAYPYADNQDTKVSGGAFPVGIAISSDELTGASQNPGTFTLTSSGDNWIAATIAVEPGAASASAVIPRRRRP